MLILTKYSQKEVAVCLDGYISIKCSRLISLSYYRYKSPQIIHACLILRTIRLLTSSGYQHG